MDLKTLLPVYREHSKKDHYDYAFTIFTPVFNRGNTLKRVFDSLNKQSFKDFELLLINDGSTDNSHEVALKLIETATFPVNYVNNSVNRHKMACIAQGVQLAKGNFFLPFDSDDSCTDNALEVFYREYYNIPDNKRTSVSGVTCLCQDQFGNPVGEPFPESPYYSNTFNNNLVSGKFKEKWGFTKTDVLKNIVIPEPLFSNGYIPEGILWELIAKQGYITKYVNETLRTYYLDTPNRISQRNHQKDAFGMAIYSLAVLNWFHQDYLFKAPKLFTKRVYTLLRASRFLNFNLKDYTEAIENPYLKKLFYSGWPFKRLLK
ncbi:glycosyltransferase family 2 protein [Mangrovimonas aestuarii]|uniref:glycosyltransferase family 2 protein n=1 Tax=Mangrovimonas aestuarii TaxID=3018443 RepID=UPI002377DAC3|nr:glycosyltransferase family 2 protein [Mangrovimonas aestuarii]